MEQTTNNAVETATTNKQSNLIVRMSANEMGLIKATARGKGMTVSKYVRELISNAINA
jgi:predicted DNA binding CopG/RHH family protein